MAKKKSFKNKHSSSSSSFTKLNKKSKTKKTQKSPIHPSVDLSHQEKQFFFQNLNEVETLIQNEITSQWPITVLFKDEDTFHSYFLNIASKYNITNMNRFRYLYTLNFLFNAYWNIFNFFQDLYDNTVEPPAVINGILEIERLYKSNQIFVTQSFTNFLQQLIDHLKTIKK